MHSHTHEITMGLAFFLGAVHALEPGHGKTAMLVYLSDRRRNVLHPLLMGISSAISHSISLIGIAFLIHAAQYALTGDASRASETAQFWLRAMSAIVVVTVGVWMLYGARRSSPVSTCSCSNHRSTSHAEDNDPSVEQLNEKTGYSVSLLLGAAFGMLPCPSAVAAYLTGMAHGSSVEAFTSIALFAFGIATSLTVVGVFVQRFGRRLTSDNSRFSKLPWATIRGTVVLLVGVGSGFSLLFW